MGMGDIPILKPDQIRQFFKSYNNGLYDPMFRIRVTKRNGLSGLLWRVTHWHWMYGHIHIVLTFAQKVDNVIPT